METIKLDEVIEVSRASATVPFTKSSKVINELLIKDVDSQEIFIFKVNTLYNTLHNNSGFTIVKIDVIENDIEYIHRILIKESDEHLLQEYAFDRYYTLSVDELWYLYNGDISYNNLILTKVVDRTPFIESNAV